MLRTITIALSTLAMLAATLAAQAVPVARAQADPGLRLISEFQVPNSRDVKFPSVVAGGNLVHVAGNVSRRVAVVWSKAASATSFPNPVELGPASGQPDFSTAAVTRAPDGSLYVAWVNQPTRTIYMRQRNTAGVWGPTRAVDNNTNFPDKPTIAVSTTGQIFIAWRDPDFPIRYRFSTDGGVNWSGRRNVSEVVGENSPLGLASGPNGSVGITFTGGTGDRLQIFVGFWNGSAFAVQRITTLTSNFADSSMSFGPDGKVYVAWRGVDASGGNSGVFYSERAPDGTWPRSRLAGGEIAGTVSVNADEGGNLHFSWLALASGDRQLFYAFKPLESAPRGPVASGDRGGLFNARGYGSVADGAYNHVVSEEFSGAGLRTRYSLFQANAVTFGGEPVVESGNGRAFRSSDNRVAVTFRNVTGAPNQLRYAWNRPPGDTDAWETFDPASPTVRIPVPASILDSTTCENTILYTQLRNTTTNRIEAQARSVTVQVDGVVEVFASIDNAIARAEANPELLNVEGAPGGDPYYTRVPLVYLNVAADSDCNGLTSLGVGSTPDRSENTYPLSSAGFSGIVPLPNLDELQAGEPTTFYVRVADGAGNIRAFPFTVTIDEDIPVLNAESPGQLSARADGKGDVLQDLTFTNINVRDDTYRPTGDPDPNRRWWGVWLANAVEPVDDPINQLEWDVLAAPPSVAVPNGAGGTNYQVTVQDWSLTYGIDPSQRIPGEDYFVYVRFLDGAGNPTERVLRIDIPVSQLDLVDVYLPAINR